MVVFANDPVRLPIGPGRFWRWCAAIPLLLLAFAGVPVALYLVNSWTSFLHYRMFRDTWLPEPAELGQLAAGYSGVTGLTVVLLLLFRRIPVVWPGLSLIMSAPFGFMTLVTSDFYPSGQRPGVVVRFIAETPFLVGGVAMALAWGMTHLAVRVLTRPWAADVADGLLELTTPLRGKGRLRVRRDRLLLDKLSFPGGRVPVIGSGKFSTKVRQLAIPYPQLRTVQIGQITERSSLRLPNGGVVELTVGPGLRIEGTHQQWVLPLPDAERVAEVVNRRAATASGRDSAFVAGGFAYLTVALVCGGAAVASVGMAYTQQAPSYLLGTLFYSVLSVTAFPVYFRTIRGIRRLQNEPDGDDEIDEHAPTAGWRAN